MSSIEISAITFAFVLAGALLGVFIGSRLPNHHQDARTKDVVRLGMGMVGTISALVLGFMISSATTYYDNQRDALTELSANLVMLGRLLQHYGPEANAAHESLRLTVGRFLVDTWPDERPEKGELLSPRPRFEDLFDQLHNLTPKDETQRAIQSQASMLLLSLGQARLLFYEQASAGVSKLFLWVMIFWLTSIFLSWGMYSPFNSTTLTTFFCGGIGRIGTNSPDLGTVHALQGPAARLKCTASSGLCCS